MTAKGTTVVMNEEPQEEVVEEEVKAEATPEEETNEEVRGDNSLDDYDDDEEIWEGGPTVGQAKAWKQAYGRVVVGTLDTGDHYVIRPMNRAEYRNHAINLERSRAASGGSLQSSDTLATEEAITMIGLLYPPMDEQELRNFGSAGFPTLVSQQIMEISNFVAVDTAELF